MPFVAVSGNRLHYEVLDLAPPWQPAAEYVVLHHGLGSSSGAWAGWIPLLAERFRVVTFDMRGHGRSDRSAGAALSLEGLVQDLLTVADAAGAQRFHLVGESIGGTIALKAALEHPGQLLTLTVSNGAHIGGSIRSVDDWRQLIDASGMSGWSEHMMRMRFFEGAISEAMWRWYAREQASASSEFVLDALRLLVGTDLSGELGRLRLPVLLLHGDASPFIPVVVMADLKSRLADARLQIFAHARHGLPFSHAKQCAQTLLNFLDEVAARGS